MNNDIFPIPRQASGTAACNDKCSSNVQIAGKGVIVIDWANLGKHKLRILNL